jgi:hypothetical protein
VLSISATDLLRRPASTITEAKPAFLPQVFAEAVAHYGTSMLHTRDADNAVLRSAFMLLEDKSE